MKQAESKIALERRPLPEPGISSPVRRIGGFLRNRWNYWEPHVASREKTATKLAAFYANRADYHQMTAKTEKVAHPQVILLLSMLRPEDRGVEFGSGGGVVLEAVAERCRSVVGMDVAPLGLEKTQRRIGERKNAAVLQADIAHAPVKDKAADFVYSLEVLEHVWNPEAVLAEMARVLKQGGLLFFTTPNGYSLDLHLDLRMEVQVVNYLGAAWVYLRSFFDKRSFRNTEPDLDTFPCYSDCDMVTKIFPNSIRTVLEANGCHLERVETYFFRRANASTASLRARFEQLESHWFLRHFGDHILVVARKNQHT